MDINVTKKIRDVYCLLHERLQKLTDKPKNFNYTKFQIIQYLLRRKDEVVYQKDIVDELNLKKSSVAESLDSLEESGEIKRTSDKEDKRRKIVSLTEKSLKRKKQFNEAVSQLNEEFVEGLSEEEIEAFLGILDKMQKNVEKNI